MADYIINSNEEWDDNIYENNTKSENGYLLLDDINSEGYRISNQILYDKEGLEQIEIFWKSKLQYILENYNIRYSPLNEKNFKLIINGNDIYLSERNDEDTDWETPVHKLNTDLTNAISFDFTFTL